MVNKFYGVYAHRIVMGIIMLASIIGVASTTQINSCSTISSPGEYMLNQDIFNSAMDSCISITSNDVVLDGGGYTIDGIGRDNTAGVQIQSQQIILTNVTVKNLKVTDWFFGIFYNNTALANISGNNVRDNLLSGIVLLNSSFSHVENNIAMNHTRIKSNGSNGTSSTGIIILGNNNIVKNNNISFNYIGISVFSGGPDGNIISANNIIEENTVTNNYGIVNFGSNQPPSSGILLGADNNIVRNNEALNNSFGILVIGSHNIIRNNNASNNSWGVGVFSRGHGSNIVSVNNTIEGNTAISNMGVAGENQPPGSGILLGESENNIIRNNTVLNNNLGIGVFSSGNNILSNNSANGNSDRGILLDNTINTVISNNNVSYNSGGILLVQGSRNNIVINNIASNNSRWGIDLSHITTDNNQIYDNTANWNNYNGINLNYSNGNTITNNIANGNGWNGIWLYFSSNNIITNNDVIMNYDNGIVLHTSSNYNDITANNANLNHHGLYLKSSRNNALSNNIANNNSAQGIVLNSSNNNILIKNTGNGNNYSGILIEYFSNYNTLNSNNASGNGDSGFHMNEASNNIIINNNLNNNYNKGVQLFNSNNNSLYHNDFIYNLQNAYDNSPNNFWDNGYPSGGNYWSDYTGIDSNNDSIGETSYYINMTTGEQDRYPFMKQNGWISTRVPGDSDGDGKVDDFELLAYIQAWANGTVGDLDLLAAIANWA